MKTVLIFILFLLASASLFAKDTLISIKIIDSRQHPVAYAKLTISNQSDTSKNLSALVDDNGRIAMPVEIGMNYTIEIAATGYKPFHSLFIVFDTTRELSFTLKEDSKALNEVTVKAVKPLMRQEDDKTVIDPQVLVESSTNGYEILEKTPGLFIDQDGNIYISSTTPATVYINGRQMRLSASDIASLLKSLPPNSIEKIEILRTPSSKYDASSSGGVVNVVLKKGVKIGLTGQLYAGAQQGRYGNQYAGGNVSNNNGGATTYMNAGINNRNYYEELTSNRFLTTDTALRQFSKTYRNQQSGYVGYGINHELNEKFEIGWDGYFTLGQNKNTHFVQNNFIVLYDTLNQSNTITFNPGSSFVSDQDVHLSYKIDTTGSEWKTNVNYVYSSGVNEQRYETASPGLYVLNGDGTFRYHQNNVTLQSDLTYKFPYSLNFESGINLSFLSFKNGSEYFTGTDNNRQPDAVRTNEYSYNQNINAAYAQLSKTFFKDAILKMGLRAENTNMSGQQTIPSDTSFNVTRTDLFPYIYLSKNLFRMLGVQLRGFLVYRRSVARPNYDQLNPFPKYVDQFLTEMGNPNLKPQFTTTYEANVCVDEYPVFAIGINDKKDMITSVYYQDGAANNEGIRTFDNIGKNREFYLKGVAGIPPGGTYFFIIGAQYNYNMYDGLYDGAPIHFTGDNWMFFTHHHLKIGSFSQLSVNGFWRLKGPMQFMDIGNIGRLNVSINRQFLKRKLTVTANVEDLFFTNNSTFSLQQGNVHVTGKRITDSRRFGINLRYNFGIRKKEERKGMFDVNEETHP